MKIYKRVPEIVEAFQWDGEFPPPEPLEVNWDNNPMTIDKVTINTVVGHLRVKPLDWIVITDDGCLVHSPASFNRVYSEVN